MQKILVIHPKDISTDFLSVIYADIDCTVINNNLSSGKLKQAIKEHEVIIMLGHGSEDGLIFYDKNNDYKRYRFIIDSKLIYLLRKKTLVGIWCNADLFFNKYNLSGLFTGMIISELIEAINYCVKATVKEIEDSNSLFASSLKESILQPGGLELIKNLYITDNNAVIDFNRNNIYFK